MTTADCAALRREHEALEDEAAELGVVWLEKFVADADLGPLEARLTENNQARKRIERKLEKCE